MSAPVDFESGTHPLAGAFRIVVILLRLDDTGRITGPDLSVLSDWIVNWDAWYRRVTGIDQGRRLHLLYRREISIATALSHRQWGEVRSVAVACRQTGAAFGITLDIAEAAKDPDALRGILEEQLIHKVTFAHRGGDLAADQLMMALSAAMEAGMHVGLVGSVRELLASGVLSTATVNARSLLIEPADHRMSQDVSDRGDACFRRFRLFVDESGDLYPCVGLMGLPQGRLGNISERFTETVLGGRRCELDLCALATHGPAINSPDSNTVGASTVCDRHRLALATRA